MALFQQTLRLATAQGSQAPRSAPEPRKLPIHGSHQGCILLSAHTQPCHRHILTLQRKWHQGSQASAVDAEAQGQTPTESPRSGCQLPLDPAQQVGCKHEHAIITAIVILRVEKWNQVNQGAGRGGQGEQEPEQWHWSRTKPRRAEGPGGQGGAGGNASQKESPQSRAVSTEAQLLILWAALVTAQCGCRRVDAHMSYSCQIPAGPASFPESVGKGVGKCGSTTQVSHRPQGGCLPPLQTSPAMSQGGPQSLPHPLREPRHSNGVGEPLRQVPLSKEARPCSPAQTQEQGPVQACSPA